MVTMRTRRVLALAMVFHAHALHSSLRANHPAAEVFVINLKDRVDKCRCMQKQLKTSPWPVQRFDAINRETVFSACPQMVNHSADDSRPSVRGTRALVCSNYLIWKRFLKESSAEHLVIFEDDAAILDDGIWEHMQHLFGGPCGSWDYLLVDPAGFQFAEIVPGCEGQKLYNLTYGFDGSHMQVFTRHAVKALIEFVDDVTAVRHPPAMDKLVRSAGYKSQYNLTKVWALDAGVVTQAHSYESLKKQPLACEASVATSEDRMYDLKHTDALDLEPFAC